ncbi:MAG: hypothetical protein P8X74_06235 [Reinekea sp.]
MTTCNHIHISQPPVTSGLAERESDRVNRAASPGRQRSQQREVTTQWVGTSESRRSLFDSRCSSSGQSEIEEVHEHSHRVIDATLQLASFPEYRRQEAQRRIRDLVAEHLKNTPKAPDFGEHGAVVIDLDEAVHGSYSGVNYGKQGIEKGASEVINTLRQEAAELHHQPLEYLRHDIQPGNFADIGLSGAITVLLTPLAFKALLAGIGEVREAREHAREFKEARQQIQGRIQQLDKVGVAVRSDSRLQSLRPLVDGAATYARQQDADLSLGEKQNRLGQSIGVASAVSGGAIMAGATTKLGTQIGLTVAAEGTSKITGFLAGSAPATVATTAVGVASSLALAPMAAVGAVGLGVTFSVKSHKKLAALKQRAEPTQEYFKNTDTANESGGKDALRTYRFFVNTKIDQRLEFYKGFDRSNKLFLAASSVYAAGAVGKAAAVATALAGIGLLSNPVTMGVTVGAAAIGGVGMALNSSQFLTGHGRQDRYDHYLSTDMPLVNRHFLASADLLSTPEQGVSLRAGFYDLIEQQDHHRQDFLVSIANETDRAFSKKLHSTDPGYRSVKERITGEIQKAHNRLWGKERVTQPADALPNMHSERRSSFSRKLKANALGVGNFFKSIAHGDIKHALANAKNTRLKHIDKLNTLTIQSWLAEPKNANQQIDYMQGDLANLKIYLDKKLETHRVMRERVVDRDNASLVNREGLTLDREDSFHSARTSFSDTDESVQFSPRSHRELDEVPAASGMKEIASEYEEQAKALYDFLVQLDKDQERDQLMSIQVEELIRELGQLRNIETPSEHQDKLALLRERYLELKKGNLYDDQQVQPIESSEANTRNFAKHILREAPQDYKHLRGILLETEMQATLARKLFEQGIS